MTDSKYLRRKGDANELAKLVAEIATGNRDKLVMEDGRDMAAVLLGRRGGLKGGRARANALSPEERSAIARRAAQRRWAKEKDD